MSQLAVGIRLDHDRRAYLPGETLSGEYWASGERPSELAAVELSVLWHSEGTGDEDLVVHYFERLAADDSDEAGHTLAGWAAEGGSRRFSTQLPSSPLSYAGLIVKIHWCVRLRAFERHGKMHVVEERFLLGSVPPAQAIETG